MQNIVERARFIAARSRAGSKITPSSFICKKAFVKTAKEIIPGGLADGKPNSDFPQSQIEKGVEVEKEHVKPIKARQEIAKDHLEEDPTYYNKLDMMESPPKRDADEGKIVDFLQRTDNPTDKNFHAMSESAGVNEHVMEGKAYGMLKQYVDMFEKEKK